MSMVGWRPIALGLGLFASSGSAQLFDNAAILKLHAAGLGEQVIVAKINASGCAYDVSTDQLIVLKRAGVPDRVIAAMVARCAGVARAPGSGTVVDPAAAARRPGLYLEREGDRGDELVMLRPTLAAGIRVTGLGSILLPYKATLVVPQPTAQLKVKRPTPVFWFYFDPSNAKVGDFGSVDTVAAQSPAEFSLVRFTAREAGRQFEIGKAKGSVEHLGIDTRTTIPVTISEMGEGVFKVEVTDRLAPGEYGFILPGARFKYRIYDFSIGDSAAPTPGAVPR